jgi:hypothetical protein
VRWGENLGAGRSALLVMLPHASGLSQSLPADNYYIGVRLDWVLHKHGVLASNTSWRGAQKCGALALTWDAKSYNAGSLKTRISIEPV